MKEMKQFIIKLEWELSFDKMTDEQRGIMVKVFFDYHNQRELDFKGDVLVEALWLNMLPNIERMNTKYLASVENGKKGGRPKKTQTNLNKPNNNLTNTLKEKVKEKVKEEVKDKVSKKEYFKLIADAMKYHNLTQEQSEELINDAYEIEDETIIL